MSSSRVEGILNGTYTGRPLSRVEALLQNGGAGGSGGSTTEITQEQFEDIMDKFEEEREITSAELAAMWGDD